MQHFAFAQWFCQFPALTCMIWLRPGIGYRLLHPLKLFIVTGLLFSIAVLAAEGHSDARPMDLAVFAMLTFVIGLVHRIRRWRDLNNGLTQLSVDIGSSPFNFQWLPRFARRNRRCARYVDPLFIAGIGVALLPFSRALAMWLLFSGACLRMFEHSVFQRQRNRDLDLVDSIMLTEDQARTVEIYEQIRSASNGQPDQGLPSGLGSDIEAQIKRRKAKAGNKTK
jgi:hypothetical protein